MEIESLLACANSEGRRRRADEALMRRLDRRIRTYGALRRNLAAVCVALLVAVPAAATAWTLPYSLSGWKSVNEPEALIGQMFAL